MATGDRWQANTGAAPTVAAQLRAAKTLLTSFSTVNPVAAVFVQLHDTIAAPAGGAVPVWAGIAPTNQNVWAVLPPDGLVFTNGVWVVTSGGSAAIRCISAGSMGAGRGARPMNRASHGNR